MKVNLFCYLLGAIVFGITAFITGSIRYFASKAMHVLSIILFVLAGLVTLFSVVVCLFAKPDVKEQEYVYETVKLSTDTGSIIYKDEDGVIKESNITLDPAVYDENGKDDYVAAIRCYIGPFYVVRDCYVYTNEGRT